MFGRRISNRAAMRPLANGQFRKLGLLPPLAAWLVALAAFTALTVETMLGSGEASASPDARLVFFVARATSYLTAAIVGASTIFFIALFGVGCGFVLRKLDGATTPRQIARAAGAGVWALACCMWCGVFLVLVWSPDSLTFQELTDPDILQHRLANDVAFGWVTKLRYAALVGFLLVFVWRLAASAKWLNAVIASAFGASLVAALVAVLGVVAGPATHTLG